MIILFIRPAKFKKTGKDRSLDRGFTPNIGCYREMLKLIAFCHESSWESSALPNGFHPKLCREILIVALRQLLPKQSVVLIDNQSAAASLKVKEQAGKVGELDQSADAQDILSIRLITLSGSASVRTILHGPPQIVKLKLVPDEGVEPSTFRS